jgi:hypothetical protein
MTKANMETKIPILRAGICPLRLQRIGMRGEARLGDANAGSGRSSRAEQSRAERGIFRMLNCPVDLIFRDCRLRLFFKRPTPGTKSKLYREKAKSCGCVWCGRENTAVATEATGPAMHSTCIPRTPEKCDDGWPDHR